MKKFKLIFYFCICCLSLCLYNAYYSNKKHRPVSKVIIIGASSGIGAVLAKEYIQRGCRVGIAGRREENLVALRNELGDRCHIKIMDISRPDKACKDLEELIEEIGGLDLLVISAGVGITDLTWNNQKEVIDVNVAGFVAVASVAIDFFIKQKSGHLAGISSILALRGSAGSPIYSATKAFESNYLEGLRARLKKEGMPIYITEIQPGLVDTAMGQASDFWRATPQKAAEQIYEAIDCKYEHAYITKRWRFIAWFFKLAPDWIFYKIF